MKKVTLVLLTLILLLIVENAYSINPTSYTTIHEQYYRAPEDTTTYSFGISYGMMNIGLIPYMRMFIPPGTIVLDLLVQEYGKQMAIARHKLPPEGLPQSPPSGYQFMNQFKLEQLLHGDCWVTETDQGNLYIAHDSFSPYLDISKAGWLYVKVGGGLDLGNYSNHFSVKVDTVAYNTWWDKYVKDAAGWDKYIESVMTYDYVPIVTPTPNPTPTPMPTCVSIMSSDFAIHIPDLLFIDGITHVWVDLKYDPAVSATGKLYFTVDKYGSK
jgi:hypothetical protein